MTLKAFTLILQRQITQKIGRFFLASGGITIGIWSICLISSLGFGVNTALIDSINSQATIRRVDIRKVEGGSVDFTKEPSFIAFNKDNFFEDFKNLPEAIDIEIFGRSDIYLQSKINTESYNCLKINQTLDFKNPESVSEFQSKCVSSTINLRTWEEFYESNKQYLIGKQSKPEKDEISICFKCGGTQLNEKLGLNSAEELLGKEISLEFKNTVTVGLIDKAVQARDLFSQQKNFSETKVKTFKVVSVIDDSKTEASIFNLNLTIDLYIDGENVTDTLNDVDLGYDKNLVGFYGGSVFARNFNDIDKIIDHANSKGYVAFAFLREFAKSAETAVLVLSYILAGFGLIALIASIFGIINVMIISVLERQKEIGVLKSLGAKDRDIFSLFLIETTFLGFLGWLMGLILTLISNLAISWIFIKVLDSNQDWKANLYSLGIKTFDPLLTWQIALITLVLAVVFTVISGVYPALKASKQNPVDVLRAE